MAFYPLANGEVSFLLTGGADILAFVVVLLALLTLTLGLSGLGKLFASVQVLFSRSLSSYAGDAALSAAIMLSYVSSGLWILYILATLPLYGDGVSLIRYISALGGHFLYAFICAELVFRPIKMRAAYLKEQQQEQ